MGLSKHHPVRQRAIEKETRAFDLRRMGYTQRQIGAAMGISQNQVQKILRRGFERALKAHRESADEVLQLELEKLDALWRKMWLSTITDEEGNPLPEDRRDPRKIEVMLKIMERKSKLLGLDAPTKTQSLTVGVDLTSLTDDELRLQMEQMGMVIEANQSPIPITYQLPGETLPLPPKSVESIPSGGSPPPGPSSEPSPGTG